MLKAVRKTCVTAATVGLMAVTLASQTPTANRRPQHPPEEPPPPPRFLTPPQLATPTNAGPYDPFHLIPPVITVTGPANYKALAPLLPIPGGHGAAAAVTRNQTPITAIIGAAQYQTLWQWEKDHEPPNPNAPIGGLRTHKQ